MRLILVYITNPNMKTAEEIAEQLLAKKLIACANIHESRSLYNWEGKLVEEKEIILLAKTMNKNFSKIKKEVKLMHPYKIPAIIKINAESNRDYASWVKTEIKDKKHKPGLK